MTFIPQTKSTDYSKIKSNQIEEMYFASKKYDGQYVQMHKVDNKVKFFSSTGKEFFIKEYAEKLLSIPHNFIVEAEYIGSTDGILGQREACTLSSFFSDFKKNIITSSNGTFKVFDILFFNEDIKNIDFKERLKILENLNLDIVENSLMTLDEAKELNDQLFKNGIEGLMLKSPSHMHIMKRTTKAIKLKNRPTHDLIFKDAELREDGTIKVLVLEDENGILARVPNIQHHYRTDEFINRIVEISYERIGNSYIQPVFIGIRYDK